MSTNELRLRAEDSDDLQIVSAALQDAVCKVGDLTYDGKARRFVCEMNRFAWERMAKNGKGPYFRARSALAVESVLSVKARGLAKADKELVVSLLNLSFEPSEEAPSGILRLHFAGDGELALEVECVDVSLLDGPQSWPTKHRPDHERQRR